MPVASHVCSGSYRRSESCPMGFLFPTQVLRFPRRTEIAGLGACGAGEGDGELEC